MAPTPNVNTHRLSLTYVIALMTHKIQFWVNAFETGGVFYLRAFNGSSPDFADAVSEFSNKLFPVFPASTAGGAATLYERVEGAFVPVATTSFSGTPDAAHTTTPATQAYLTFVDTQQVKSHIVISEPGFTVPYKTLAGGAMPSTNFDAFLDDVLDVSDGHIGDIIASLAGNPLGVFKSVVGDTNEKLRRMRGLK